MHILLIHQAFAALDEPGGTRHHELARHLVDRGHQVTVIAGRISYLTGKASRRGRAARTVDDRGVRILRAGSTGGWHRSFPLRLASFLTFWISATWLGLGVRRVDVVWGTSPPLFQAAAAWLLARLKGAGFLMEVRDLWPWFAVAAGVLRQPLLIRLSEWLERSLYRWADKLVVNSPGFVEHVRGRGGLDLAVVPNGADVAMFERGSTGNSFRRKHGLQRKFVVLYAGAHGLSNDLDVVVEAAEQLRDRRDVVFALLGDGMEKPRLQARANRLGLENLRFLPAMAKREMAGALAAADACLAILKPLEAYRTTYPNKVFDYMAAGRPVILAIDGAIREVVEAARGGVFVPPGDAAALAAAVRGLAADRRRTRRMGEAGRRFVAANFDRRALAGVMERALLDAARRRRRARGGMSVDRAPSEQA